MRKSGLEHHELSKWSNHTNCRVKEAIDAWRPDRPRWWLSHYGEILYGGDDGVDIRLKMRFLRLRAEAISGVKVGKVKGLFTAYKLHLHDI